MLDLKKLAEGVRASLAKETTESIDLWFQEYENEAIKSYLGEGEYCQEPVKSDCYCLALKSPTKTPQSENDSSEYQYLEAA